MISLKNEVISIPTDPTFCIAGEMCLRIDKRRLVQNVRIGYDTKHRDARKLLRALTPHKMEDLHPVHEQKGCRISYTDSYFLPVSPRFTFVSTYNSHQKSKVTILTLILV